VTSDAVFAKCCAPERRDRLPVFSRVFVFEGQFCIAQSALSSMLGFHSSLCPAMPTQRQFELHSIVLTKSAVHAQLTAAKGSITPAGGLSLTHLNQK
jgi:hypothetical protein